MNVNVLKEIGLALLFVLLQALVFNKISLFGIAVPLVFIYIIIKMPINMSALWMLTLSFLLGLAVDIFSDTYGMNALACTILAFIRPKILSLYLTHISDYMSEVPSIRTLGMWLYVRYALTFVFLYCVVLYLIESMSFFDLPILVLRIVGSTVLTFLLILSVDSLVNRSEKRL